MKSINIKLDTIEKVKEFVNTVNLFDGDFDLVVDRFVIDAKSIMGIFSLDISKPIRLDIHDNASIENPEEALKKFIV